MSCHDWDIVQVVFWPFIIKPLLICNCWLQLYYTHTMQSAQTTVYKNRRETNIQLQYPLEKCIETMVRTTLI